MRASKRLLSQSSNSFVAFSNFVQTSLLQSYSIYTCPHERLRRLAVTAYSSASNRNYRQSRGISSVSTTIASVQLPRYPSAYPPSTFEFLAPAVACYHALSGGTINQQSRRPISHFGGPFIPSSLRKHCRVLTTTPLNPLTQVEKNILDRSLTLQSHADTILRCTEIDSEGNVVAISRDFKKTELCTKHGLLPRDLRKLESKVMVPHILVRKGSILVNLLHIRALVKANTVLLFDVYGSTNTYTQSAFIFDLQGKLSSRSSKPMGGLPYEMRALEAILISVMAVLEAELKVLQENVVRLLEELEDNIDRDKLRFLLIYSKKLSTFEQKAQLISGAIDEVLDADDDLAGMYLTEKMQGVERPADEHSEIEMLLESYYKMADEIVQISGNLVSNIKNTEDIVNIILDANRNSLMLLDLKFSIGTLSTGCGAAIAALYGMNLKNFIEESDFAFLSVSGFAFALSAVIFGYGLHRLRRTQRLTMWGEGSVKATPGRKWRSLAEHRKLGHEDKADGQSS